MKVEEINIIKKNQKKMLKEPKSQEIKNPDLYQRINTFISIKSKLLSKI